MGIRILSENEIKPAASSFHAPSLLYANPKNLYQRRAKRLRELAENNAFRDYLLFAADIVDIQLELLETQPIKDISLSLNMLLEKGNSPLNAKQFQRSDEWRVLLLQLITRYRCKAKDEVLPTLEWLEKASQSELESLADHLCNERYEEVSADKAVFIWAALSLYWVQLAQQLPRQTQSDVGGRQTCPVCDSSPVTSVVHFGDTQGLRYLHCALCESEWNMVRAKCSNCEQSGKLDYWSLDSHDAAVKAESCGDCGSYLKILSQEKDPQVEPVADDLATLFLDVEMEEKNLHRTGLNPFMFVGN